MIFNDENLPSCFVHIEEGVTTPCLCLQRTEIKANNRVYRAPSSSVIDATGDVVKRSAGCTEAIPRTAYSPHLHIESGVSTVTITAPIVTGIVAMARGTISSFTLRRNDRLE